MFTEHYVKKLRLETNTKKLTSNSFSTRRPLGPKRGSGAGIACCVNAKRNPDILKYSQLARIKISDGFNWPAMAILFYILLPIAHKPWYLKMRTNPPTCETAKSWDSLREVPGVPGILSEVLKVPGVPGLLSEVLGMPGVLLWVPLGKLDLCSVEAGTFCDSC